MSQSVINDSTLTSIADAIRAKGGATGPMLPQEMAGAIDAIPSGGSGGWVKPEDWPDLRKVMDDDNPTDYGISAAYTHKLGMLFDSSFKGWNVFNLAGAKAYRLSDGTVVKSNTGSTTRPIGEKYFWIICYSDVDFSENIPTSSKYFGNGAQMAKWYIWRGCSVQKYKYTTFAQNSATKYDDVRFEGMSRFEATDTSRGNFIQGIQGNVSFDVDDIYVKTFSLQSFISKTRSISANIHVEMMAGSWSGVANIAFTLMKKVPTGIDWSKVTSLNQVFQYTYELEELPEDMDLSNCTSIWFGFTNCNNLKALPDVIDLSGITSENNQAHAFDGLFSLLKFPQHITSKWSLMIGALNATYTSPSTVSAFDYDSFAKFDGAGNIIGGLVYNLNTCPNSGQTMTFNRPLYNHFSEDQRSKIADMFTSKNWQLVW